MIDHREEELEVGGWRLEDDFVLRVVHVMITGIPGGIDRCDLGSGGSMNNNGSNIQTSGGLLSTPHPTTDLLTTHAQ